MMDCGCVTVWSLDVLFFAGCGCVTGGGVGMSRAIGSVSFEEEEEGAVTRFLTTCGCWLSFSFFSFSFRFRCLGG